MAYSGAVDCKCCARANLPKGAKGGQSKTKRLDPDLFLLGFSFD